MSGIVKSDAKKPHFGKSCYRLKKFHATISLTQLMLVLAHQIVSFQLNALWHHKLQWRHFHSLLTRICTVGTFYWYIDNKKLFSNILRLKTFWMPLVFSWSRNWLKCSYLWQAQMKPILYSHMQMRNSQTYLLGLSQNQMPQGSILANLPTDWKTVVQQWAWFYAVCVSYPNCFGLELYDVINYNDIISATN